MKNTNIKFLLCTLIVLISSCADSFLDKEPISGFSAKGFYKNPSDAQAGVYGIYNSMQSAFRQNFALWGEGRADAVATNHAEDPFALTQNRLTPVIQSARWDNLYTVISRANYAIKYVPQVFESEEGGLRNQLIGQARALRAIAYFYAVRVWGDVPLILEPFESVQQNIFSERTNQETVLDMIEEDLLYASTYCADNYTGARNRVILTKGAAEAFLTQVYMWRKKYTEAIATAESVIESPFYSLVSMQDWNKIFTDGMSNESIFEIGYNEIQTNSLRVIYALGSDSYYFPSLKFRDEFEEDDLRKTRIYDITQNEPRKIWKFFGEGFNDESPDPSSNNIVMVRLADIILLKAEAHAHLNEPDLALPLLNEIRRRAGLPNLELSDANGMYGDLVSAVLHERAVELCYEGHRWFDLVRNGKVIEVMGPINSISDTRNFVWPIHEDVINRNPNIVQNEFYK